MTKSTTVRLPIEKSRAAEKLAKSRGLSVAGLVESLIDREIARSAATGSGQTMHEIMAGFGADAKAARLTDEDLVRRALEVKKPGGSRLRARRRHSA